MNIFEAVKQSVTTRQAAESYGIRVNKNGMAVCPFHRDKNPSMKVDRRFHCFGCQADGDVIDFTAHLYNLKPKEAEKYCPSGRSEQISPCPGLFEQSAMGWAGTYPLCAASFSWCTCG